MRQEDMDFYVADGKLQCAKCDSEAYVMSGHHECCGVMDFVCKGCEREVEVRD